MGMMRQPVPVPVPETDMEGSKVQTKGRNGRWRDNGRGKCTNHNVSANLSHDRAFQILWFDINAGATRSFQPRSARCLPLRYAASAPSQRLVCAPCCCQAPEFVSTLRCRTPIELRRRKNRRRSGVEIGAPTRSRPFLGIKLRGNLFPRPVPPCSSSRRSPCIFGTLAAVCRSSWAAAWLRAMSRLVLGASVPGRRG